MAKWRRMELFWELGLPLQQEVAFRFPEFDATGPIQHLTDAIGYFCNQTQALYFHEDPDPQVLVVSKESKFLNPPVAGTEAPIKQAQGNRLIIDTSKDRGWERSAIELCSSPFSHGPDFVSVREGMYCDMHEKRLWKLCTRKEKLNGDKTPVVSKAY
ncbi:hypothetical protein F5X68DRAFT_189578 [Plectosphaerella plurivora]|uniref:Uncharacterized protein n=1 Tax=Plectosphaerella plurivora TaxID=936078 RepID=A0A9P8VH01_9PEZI|nr:hypothetical protein F5X68DRAFT_189578 [Plectosphaerella plurivora]